jgi:hypothetical protein
MKRKIFGGLAGVLLGCQKSISVHSRAIFHGHYHPEDQKELELAKAERQTGIGLITGNDHLYNKGIATTSLGRKSGIILVGQYAQINYDIQ